LQYASTVDGENPTRSENGEGTHNNMGTYIMYISTGFVV